MYNINRLFYSLYSIPFTHHRNIFPSVASFFHIYRIHSFPARPNPFLAFATMPHNCSNLPKLTPSEEGCVPSKRVFLPRKQNSWVLDGRIRDGESHYIAESKWGVWVEKLLMPYTVNSIEAYATYMFLFSLFLTLPMGIHRIMDGSWTVKFFQLQIVNYVREYFGFQPWGGVLYVTYPTDEERPGIDSAFSLHIIAGLSWLTCGFLQFFTKNMISKRAHRQLGYVSCAVLLFHLTSSTYMIYMNNMLHPALTRMMLFQDVFTFGFLAVEGIYAARNKESEKHQDIMVHSFVISVDGAGTIRFAAFCIWIIARLCFTPEAAAYFDMGACYAEAATTPMGVNAYHCQGPYLLRLVALRLVSHYHQAMYLRLPEKIRDEDSRKLLREEIIFTIKYMVALIVVLIASFQLDNDFTWVKEYLDLIPGEIQLLFYVSSNFSYLHGRYMHVRKKLIRPRRMGLIPGRESLLKNALEAARGLNESARSLYESARGLNESARGLNESGLESVREKDE